MASQATTAILQPIIDPSTHFHMSCLSSLQQEGPNLQGPAHDFVQCAAAIGSAASRTYILQLPTTVSREAGVGPGDQLLRFVYMRFQMRGGCAGRALGGMLL